jgi:hypothetical protein
MEDTMKFKRIMSRGKAVFMNAVIGALAIMTLWPSLTQASWTTQGVDTPKSFSNMSSRSIAIDKTTGYPHIAYGEDRLYHAYHSGSQWVYETVDASPGVGQYASIAVDSNGKIHISYWDAINGELKYATNMLGVWQAVILDSGKVGQFASIAIDGGNKVHISYNDAANGDLKYATNASGSWVLAAVDSAGNVGY